MPTVRQISNFESMLTLRERFKTSYNERDIQCVLIKFLSRFLSTIRLNDKNVDYYYDFLIKCTKYCDLS